MRDDGPSFSELALILVLIAIVSAAALLALGGEVRSTLRMVSDPV